MRAIRAAVSTFIGQRVTEMRAAVFMSGHGAYELDARVAHQEGWPHDDQRDLADAMREATRNAEHFEDGDVVLDVYCYGKVEGERSLLDNVYLTLRRGAPGKGYVLHAIARSLPR